jgi:hypothetical protein
VASTTETTVYTVPGATKTIVKQFVICNTTTTDATILISLVPSAGAAGDGNRIIKSLTIPANGVVTIDLFQVMAAGGFISIKQGTSSACTTTVSGVEVT